MKSEKTLNMFLNKPNMFNDEYKTWFEAFITALESYGGCVTIRPAWLTAMQVTDVDNPGETKNTKAEAKVK